MKILLLVLLVLLVNGCSIRNYAQSTSKIITFKTPKLKFSDLAYLHKSNEAVKLDMYVAGSLVQSISINHLVCISNGCMRKSSFNREFLNATYPDSLLQNVLLGKSIYEAKNRVKLESGFEQKIENDNVKILYKVNAKEIYFKDKKNHILFRIRSVE